MKGRKGNRMIDLPTIIAIVGAICAAIIFTFGMKAITSTIVIELNEEPMTAPEASRKVSMLIVKAIMFFSISFIIIVLTHN